MRLRGSWWPWSSLAAAAAAASAWWWLNRPLTLASRVVELSIEPGTHAARDRRTAGSSAGVRTSPQLLYEWFRWSGQARQIRAGSYEIGRGTTPVRLLDKMVRGDETLATRASHRGLDLPPDPRRAGHAPSR